MYATAAQPVIVPIQTPSYLPAKKTVTMSEAIPIIASVLVLDFIVILFFAL